MNNAAVPKPPQPQPTVFYRPETYDPEDSAAYLMRRILTCVASEVDAALEPRGLTSAQWVPLLKLHLGHASRIIRLMLLV